MGAQSGEDMVAVLPYRLGHNQFGVGVDVREHFHAHALVGDETVLLHRIVGVAAFDGDAFFGKGRDDTALHVFLRRPAYLIGGQAQVAGTQGDGLRLRSDPGLQTTTLKTVLDGAQLLILDGPRDVDGITWWRLRDPADGAEGWAAQLYLIPVSGP